MQPSHAHKSAFSRQSGVLLAFMLPGFRSAGCDRAQFRRCFSLWPGERIYTHRGALSIDHDLVQVSPPGLRMPAIRICIHCTKNNDRNLYLPRSRKKFPVQVGNSSQGPGRWVTAGRVWTACARYFNFCAPGGDAIKRGALKKNYNYVCSKIVQAYAGSRRLQCKSTEKKLYK